MLIKIHEPTENTTYTFGVELCTIVRVLSQWPEL